MVMSKKLSNTMKTRLASYARFEGAPDRGGRDYRTTEALIRRGLVTQYEHGEHQGHRHVVTAAGYEALGLDVPDVECPRCGERHYGHFEHTTLCVSCAIEDVNGYTSFERWTHASVDGPAMVAQARENKERHAQWRAERAAEKARILEHLETRRIRKWGA